VQVELLLSEVSHVLLGSVLISIAWIFELHGVGISTASLLYGSSDLT
jgi:hypothetical protein